MPDISSDLRVPKHALKVEIALLDCGEKQVEIFLAQHHDHAWTYQEVTELFQEMGSFLPAHDPIGDSWFLFNKDAVIWVNIPLALSVGNTEAEEEIFDVRKMASVELAGGKILSGHLLYSAPTGAARVADHLNSTERFLRLWSESGLYLVNKALIRRVVELTLGGRISTEG